MEIADALAFCRDNHRSVLATRRSSGDPQMSPVVHGVIDGRIVISSREPAYKVRNLRRDPTVSLCAFTEGFFGSWVQVDGRATIISMPDALDGLVELYRQVAGEHDDWDDYRAAMTRDQRVIIAVEPLTAGPDRAG